MIAVMRRIGMPRRANLDFDHPRPPQGHALRRSVVFAATAGAPARKGLIRIVEDRLRLRPETGETKL